MLKSIISNIFKKKKKMSFENNSLEELKAELSNSDFQWIKGEQSGMIEKYESVSEEGSTKFLNFKGGNRINIAIIREFMDIYPSTQVDFNINPTPLKLIASPQTTKESKESKVNSIKYDSNVQVGIDESPIYKLLKKQKPNWVNVNISLKLNLPTKSLYNVLVSSFEDADTEISNYVTEGVEIEDIRNAIAESIRTSFYDTKKNSDQKINKKEIEKNELSED
jgi:hypothetical protein